MKLVVYLLIPIIVVASALLSYNIFFPLKIESQPEIQKIDKLLGDSQITVISEEDLKIPANKAKIVIPEIKNPTIAKILPDVYKASEKAVEPFLFALETKKPVIYIGIDDGVVKNPEALEFFKKHKWPVTIFPNQIYFKENPDYFKAILDSGANLGNHTNTHPNLIKLTYEQQKKEICDSQDAYKSSFGITPKLFRPPFGNYNENTLKAARACGLTATIGWKARVDEGKVWYQVGEKLNAGEIVLMHFRPQVMDDLRAFETEITKQNLTVANMEEWIQ
jgi:peptidoglycan/xylan/chitin deacetylase (PgdA/CDA1 family)